MSSVSVQPAGRRESYRVQLAVFEGPLALLLHLIEREKLDISSVSLAQIADQFLQYLAELETVGADILADFLVVAARLVCIKSRLLLPLPAIPDDEDDQGEALAQQLREYKRFKLVASGLQSIESAGRRSYLRIAEPPDLQQRLDGSHLSLKDLLAAAVSVFTARIRESSVASVVSPLVVTVSDQIELIYRMTADGRKVAFSELIRTARNRQEVIVTLLAILELLKRSRINVQQDSMFGEITITPAQGAEAAPVHLEDGMPEGPS